MTNNAVQKRRQTDEQRPKKKREKELLCTGYYVTPYMLDVSDPNKEILSLASVTVSMDFTEIEGIRKGSRLIQTSQDGKSYLLRRSAKTKRENEWYVR